MSFASDLAKFAAKTEKNIDTLRRGVAVDIFSKVILRSPVDTGRFRGNWQASVENPLRGQLNITDQTGQTAISKAVQAANQAKGDQSIWLTNNLPYGYRLEYESWSQQAPQGMVRLSVQEFRRALAAQLRALK